MLPDTKGSLTLKRIVKLCGKVAVVPQKWHPGLASWAGLVDSTPSTLRKFIKAINSTRQSPTYIHDVGLPVHCPELLEGPIGRSSTSFHISPARVLGIILPYYITGDLLRLFPPGVQNSSSSSGC